MTLAIAFVLFYSRWKAKRQERIR